MVISQTQNYYSKTTRVVYAISQARRLSRTPSVPPTTQLVPKLGGSAPTSTRRTSSGSANSHAWGLLRQLLLNMTSTAHLAHKLGGWTPQNYSDDMTQVCKTLGLITQSSQGSGADRLHPRVSFFKTEERRFKIQDPQPDSSIQPKARGLLHMECDFIALPYISTDFQGLSTLQPHYIIQDYSTGFTR